MPVTTEMAKKAWEHGRKSIDHYNGLTDQQKAAFWDYGHDNGLIDTNNFDDYKKSEYTKYATNTNRFIPQAAKTETVNKNKLIKQDGQIVGVETVPEQKVTGKEYDRFANMKPYTTKEIKEQPKQTASLLPPALKKVYAEEIPAKPVVPQVTQITNSRGIKQNIDPVKFDKASTQAAGASAGFIDSASLGLIPKLTGTQKMFDEAMQEAPTAAMIGKGAGYLIPGSAAAKSVRPALKGIANPILKNVAEGAIAGTELTVLEDTLKNKSLGQTAKDIGYGIAGGAVADSILGLASQGISKLAQAIVKKHGNITPDIQQAITKATELEAKPNKTPQEVQDYYDYIEYLDEVNRSDPKFINAEAAHFNENVSVMKAPKTEAKPQVSTNTIPQQQTVLKKAVGASGNITKGSDEMAATVLKEPPKSKPRKLSDNVYELQRTVSELENTGQAATPLYQETRAKLDEVSKLYDNTLKNANFLSDVEKKALNAEDFTYDVKSELESLANARKRIATNINGEIQNLSTKQAYTGEDFDTAMEILKDKYLNEARQTGNYSQVKDWLKNIRKFSTEAGRAVQAHAKYSRTPEGMAAAAQRMVDKANETLKKQNPKLYEIKKAKGELQELTDNDIKEIVTGMEKAEQLPEGWEKQAELAKVQKKITEMLPPTMIDKFKGIQRIAFLLNPKTLLTRNPLGNLILQGAETLKDYPGTLVDKLVSSKTGQRTTNLPNLDRLKAGGQGAKQGISDTLKDWKSNVNTSPTGGQAEIQKARVFENNVLNKLDETVSKALQLGDRPFYQAAYNDRITQLKQLNKSDVVTDAMKIDAEEFALERTFQNDTTLSKLFSRVKKASDDPVYQVFINTVLPFTKTPANILNKLIEYTPAGFVKSMAELGTSAKTGKAFNQKYFVDNIGRALTGTGILALGYAGAKNGFITGKPDKDKEVAAIERLIGIQPYAFVTKDGSYTFDWAQPVSALLAIGADAYFGGKSKDTFSEQLQAGAEAAGNTFFNMSMLQGLTQLFNQYNPASGVINSVTGGITGLGTPTILNQTTKVLDPYVRETEGKKLNQIMSKTPGLSQNLPVKLDLFGIPIEQFQGRGLGAKALESYLSPGYYASAKNSTPELKEAYRVYKSTGEKAIFPRLTPKEITDKGKPIKLSVEEQQEFQKVMGEKNLKGMKNLISYGSYKVADDEAKAKMIKNLVDDNFTSTRKYILNKKKIGLKGF